MSVSSSTAAAPGGGAGSATDWGAARPGWQGSRHVHAAIAATARYRGDRNDPGGEPVDAAFVSTTCTPRWGESIAPPRVGRPQSLRSAANDGNFAASGSRAGTSSPAGGCRYFGDLNTPSHHHGSLVARIAIIAAACLTAAGARESRTGFAVTATVMAMAAIDSQTMPDGVDISADDLRRGYVEVREPAVLTVRSNSPAGYALELTTAAPLATSMIVRGLDDELSLGAEGGTIIQRWTGARTVHLSLTFTLVLAPGLAAGRYPWPVRLAVRPLEST